MTEKANPVLHYFLNIVQRRIFDKVGHTWWGYVIAAVNRRKGSSSPIRIVSIGSGPAGWEMKIAQKFNVNYEFECIDINENMMALGKEQAFSHNLNFKFILQDINELSLPTNYYDVVMAHASLHHMINHEHVAKEINKSMRNDGEFVVFDAIPRNGLKMWDDTIEVANRLWSLIPLKYRYDAVNKSTEYFETLPNKDLSVDGFECIRSQDLYPVLKQNFKTKIEVPAYYFARRFFEDPFANNYDIIKNPFDKAVADTVIRMEDELAKSYNLKPECIFMVLEKC